MLVILFLFVQLLQLSTPNAPIDTTQNPLFDISAWDVHVDSKLQIHGSTNVNSFGCSLMQYEGNDKMLMLNDDQNVLLSGKIEMRAKGFDCGNKMMTKDFKKTLREDDFPYITISFKELKRVISASDTLFIGELQIDLAGESRSFGIECKKENVSEDQFYLTGKQDFLFSDFDMKAPRKFFGTIRVDDEVQVEFRLKLTRNTNPAIVEQNIW